MRPTSIYTGGASRQMQPTGGIRKPVQPMPQTTANTRPAPITSRLADITLVIIRISRLPSACLAAVGSNGEEASGPVPQRPHKPVVCRLNFGHTDWSTSGAQWWRSGGSVPIAPSSPHHAPVPHAAAFIELMSTLFHPTRRRRTANRLADRNPPSITVNCLMVQAAPRPTAQSAHQRYAIQPDVQSTSVQGVERTEATSASSRSSHQTSNRDGPELADYAEFV